MRFICDTTLYYAFVSAVLGRFVCNICLGSTVYKSCLHQVIIGSLFQLLIGNEETAGTNSKKKKLWNVLHHTKHDLIGWLINRMLSR